LISGFSASFPCRLMRIDFSSLVVIDSDWRMGARFWVRLHDGMSYDVRDSTYRRVCVCGSNAYNLVRIDRMLFVHINPHGKTRYCCDSRYYRT
jgi:hypothetical protein